MQVAPHTQTTGSTPEVTFQLPKPSNTASSAPLSLAHHTAGRWYKRTNPGGDGTCHSVAAGTTTGSLTAGTPYTYRAYDTTICNSADEIAEVTFTTS